MKPKHDMVNNVCDICGNHRTSKEHKMQAKRCAFLTKQKYIKEKVEK